MSLLGRLKIAALGRVLFVFGLVVGLWLSGDVERSLAGLQRAWEMALGVVQDPLVTLVVMPFGLVFGLVLLFADDSGALEELRGHSPVSQRHYGARRQQPAQEEPAATYPARAPAGEHHGADDGFAGVLGGVFLALIFAPLGALMTFDAIQKGEWWGAVVGAAAIGAAVLALCELSVREVVLGALSIVSGLSMAGALIWAAVSLSEVHRIDASTETLAVFPRWNGWTEVIDWRDRKGRVRRAFFKAPPEKIVHKEGRDYVRTRYYESDSMFHGRVFILDDPVGARRSHLMRFLFGVGLFFASLSILAWALTRLSRKTEEARPDGQDTGGEACRQPVLAAVK
jgi:hypothetical protein